MYIANRVPRERFLDYMALAADHFIVGNGERELIAGYPWFGVWGRDAMIALPGIALATGRHDEARRVLLDVARHMRKGAVADLVDEAGVAAYNSADASLWFVLAVYRYLEATNDEAAVKNELFGAVKKVVDAYAEGSGPVEVHEDGDGLLKCGPRLTWMDAAVGGEAVTPREGKPVEVNALWYNALRIAQLFGQRFGERGYAEQMGRKAEKTRKAFGKYWNGDGGCLFDVLEPDDASVRPNQLFAVSLPLPLLEGERAAKVVEKVQEELLTPYGLRTLSQKDAKYKSRYEGNQEQRDAAYHNGIMWPWLIGPFVDAHIAVGKKDADRFLGGFRKQLLRGCLGCVPELVEPETWRSDGCFAQAWSVGEVLRAYLRVFGQKG